MCDDALRDAVFRALSDAFIAAGVEYRFGAHPLEHASRNAIRQWLDPSLRPPVGHQLTREAYAHACLLRSTALPQALLVHHQTFPALFRPGLQVPLGRSRRWLLKQRINAQEFGGLRYPVQERNDVFVWRPKTLKDLALLAHGVLDVALGERLGPEHVDYFTALGAGSVDTWRASEQAILKRWPRLSPEVLHKPWMFPLAARAEIVGEGQVVPRGAQSLVVDKHSTEADRDRSWKQVQPKERRGRGQRDRVRPAALARRIAVWDT
jgi:hypothetical protein